MKTSIVAIANQKGGVGKTATAVNLAVSYARLGKRTLLIDFDYQGNATANFGLKLKAKDAGRVGSEALKKDLPLSKAVLPTEDKHLDIVAGDMGLSKLSREKILDPGAAMMLRNWLDSDEARNYDIILIDTHPNLDLLFQMAMTASHYYLVPMFAEADPFDGLQYMFEEIAQIKAGLNKQLFFLGLVITKFDKSNTTHRKFFELLTEFGEEHKIRIRGVIPESKAVAGSSSAQKPLLWHMEHLPITKAYIDVAKDLLPDLKGARMGRQQTTPQIAGTPVEIAKLFGDVQNAEVF
jgi:chromosome partitioning protein